MRLYTRTGDDGTTGLIGGARVGKDDLAIEAYGTIDELNAQLGAARALADHPAWLDELLDPIQHELFTIGSHLALHDEASPADWKLPPIRPEWFGRLERQIDAATAELPPLREFVLPGGSRVAATLHVARTVCRRAERRIVSLSARRSIEGPVIEYVNRLSDWLFVHARLANARAGVADVGWKKER